MMGRMLSSTSVLGSGALSKFGYVMSDKVEETSGFRNRKLMARGPLSEWPRIPTSSLLKDTSQMHAVE